MKKAKYILSIIFFTCLLLGCKRSCTCTMVNCSCPELSILVTANLDNNEPGSFKNQELDDFYLVRTNLKFEIIDSIKIEFGNVVGNVDYNKNYWINKNKFSNFTSFKDYSFIISNVSISYFDTISNIDYEETANTITCNKCSNCEDEKISCTNFENFKFEYNGKLNNGVSIKLTKQ